MAPKPTRLALDRREMTFAEYDEGLVSVDGRTCLTGPVQTSWKQDSLALEHSTVQFLQEGAPNSFEAAMSPDLVSLAVALPAPSFLQYQGVGLDERTVAILRPGRDLSTYARDVCRYCIVSMPMDRFRKTCERYDPALLNPLLEGPDFLRIPPASVRSCREAVLDLYRSAAAGRIPATARASLEHDILATFFDALGHHAPGSHRGGRPRHSRQRFIERIKEYCAATRHTSATVEELVRHVGCRERTLRKVVRELYGVSPKQLLLFRKLHEVHAALTVAGPDETVTGILADHGVWETGRFAGRYRRLFGEPPSATLARI